MSVVKFNRNNKFDLQLDAAMIEERRLAEIFAGSKIELIELKTENYQWEQTGNICIEYEQRGKPSGISVTEADMWVHQLKRGDQTLLYLMIPVERLKELCRASFHDPKRNKRGGGDGNRFSNIVLPLRELLK